MIDVNELGIKFKMTKDNVYLGQMYDYVKNLTGSILRKNSWKASLEDIAGMTILKIHDKIDSFDPDRGTFNNWLYTIISNDILNEYRYVNKKGDSIDAIGKNIIEGIADEPIDDTEQLTGTDVMSAFESFDPRNYINSYGINLLVSLLEQKALFIEYMLNDFTIDELVEKHPEHKLNSNSAKTMLRRMRFAFIQHLIKSYPTKQYPKTKTVNILEKKGKLK